MDPMLSEWYCRETSYSSVCASLQLGKTVFAFLPLSEIQSTLSTTPNTHTKKTAQLSVGSSCHLALWSPS